MLHSTLSLLALLTTAPSALAQIPGVTVRSATSDALSLRPASRSSTFEEALAFAQSGQRGSKILLTCAVTLESLQAAFDGNQKKLSKFIEKTPTGFELMVMRAAPIPVDPKFNGTITARPDQMQTALSLDVQFVWDLFAQTTGGAQFLQTSGRGSQLAGICVAPARMDTDPLQFRLGHASSRGSQAVIRPVNDAAVSQGPSLWNYSTSSGDSLGCEFDSIIAQYKSRGLDLVCDYGSHSPIR